MTTMFGSRRKRALVWMACYLSTTCSPASLHVSAFTVKSINIPRPSSSPSQHPANKASRTTIRNAVYASNDNNGERKPENSTRRRGFLRSIGSAVTGIATAAILRANTDNGGPFGAPSPALAIADISTSSNKRVVQIEVANLGGVPGKFGTFKIQLRPEWAPRGARRFEVCLPKPMRNIVSIFHMLLCSR